MQKSQILNIILASVIVAILIVKRDIPPKRETIVEETFERNENDSNKVKRSLGVRNFVFPEPAMVIGSYDKEGKPNIMTAAWFGVANSKPLKVSVSLRPATYSYHCIMESQAFTVNVPDASLISYVQFAGRYSGKDMNKFEVTKLTPVKAEFVNAPYVKEFPIVLECKLTEYHDLGSHRQFIGEVIDAKVNENLLTNEDRINMELFNPVIYGQGKYYSGLDLIDDIKEIKP